MKMKTYYKQRKVYFDDRDIEETDFSDPTTLKIGVRAQVYGFDEEGIKYVIYWDKIKDVESLEECYNWDEAHIKEY